MILLWRMVFGVALLTTCVLCLAPIGVSSEIASGDKVVHFSMFFADAMLGMMATSRPRQVTVFLGLIALGVALEMGQGLVPGRMPSLADAAANTFGVGAAALLGRVSHLSLALGR